MVCAVMMQETVMSNQVARKFAPVHWLSDRQSPFAAIRDAGTLAGVGRRQLPKHFGVGFGQAFGGVMGVVNHLLNGLALRVQSHHIQGRGYIPFVRSDHPEAQIAVNHDKTPIFHIRPSRGIRHYTAPGRAWQGGRKWETTSLPP
jgi:hypothetical protein